jgi:hypothetical protein
MQLLRVYGHHHQEVVHTAMDAVERNLDGINFIQVLIDMILSS